MTLDARPLSANEITAYQQKIQKLERELDEMTAALSQAWDQLVPFLQEVSIHADTAQGIKPLLDAVCVAADTDIASIYLFKSNEWFSLPEGLPQSTEFIAQLRGVTKEQRLTSTTQADHLIHWTFAPVFSEQQIIGVLGIGTLDHQRAFAAVDMRIIKRMAERIGNQVATAQLARLRELEAIQARELQIASEIQQSVQPIEPPKTKTIRLAPYWRPAKDVGGDAWGWVQHPDGHFAWFILDVAGKGLPAALAAVALHTAISMALRTKQPVGDVLQIVNEQFYDAYTRTDLIATVAIMSLNTRTGELNVGNAGHPPVLVRNQGKWLQLSATTPPLGVLPSLSGTTHQLQLAPKDLIICYSDGFTEIESQNQLWGLEGLLSTIPSGAKNVNALTQHIVTASKYAGMVHDDQTLVSAIYIGESEHA